MTRVYSTTGKDGPKPQPVVTHAEVLTKESNAVVKTKIK
jgi:hypothetical protein